MVPIHFVNIFTARYECRQLCGLMEALPADGYLLYF